MIDYAEIARAAFDRPLAPDERAALRVWADQLEAAGDPRGGLIAIEQAEAADWDRPYRRTAAMAKHLLARAGDARKGEGEPDEDAEGEEVVAADAAGAALLGEFASVLAVGRSALLDWRAGALYGAVLDTRHVAGLWQVPATDIVARLLAMPAISTLRRLVVRVRVSREITPIVTALVAAGARLPALEQLSVIYAPVPRAVVPTSASERENLRRVFPHLWAIATGISWWLTTGSDLDDVMRADDDPADRAARIRIGHALFVPGQVRSPAAVVDRLCALGPRALPYREVLEAFLMPEGDDGTMITRAGAVRVAAALGVEGLPLKRRLARLSVPSDDIARAIADIERACRVAGRAGFEPT